MSPRVGSFLTLIVTLSLTCICGCSAPPQKERDQAESAVAAAKAADAAEYAPADLQKALTALAEYDRAVAQGDYRLALSQAISARDQAYTAARVAGEAKTAARNDAEGLIVDLEGLLLMAKSRVNTLPPAANARTRSALRTGPKALQEARSRFDKQDYKGVKALLTPIVGPLRKDLPPPSTGRKGK